MAKGDGLLGSRGRSHDDYAIAVAYDGERTEDEYFRGWALVIPPARLTIIPIFVRSGGNPLLAVEKAEIHKRRTKHIAEFWCVSDCDDADEQTVRLAWERADRAGIRLCLSNRSFEIWLALHFGKTDRPITNEREAVDMVKAHIPTYDIGNKVAPFATLLPLTPTAIENAEWLAHRNCANPSTNVHGLVRKLESNLR